MNTESKQYRKTILSNPVSILKSTDHDVNEDNIITVNQLHKSYQSLRQQHKQQQIDVNGISREIGDAKSKQLPFDTLILTMKGKGQQLSHTKQLLKEAEDALYAFFQPKKIASRDVETSGNTILPHSRFREERPTITNENIAIKPLTSEHAAWNQYVANNPAASIYHQTKWQTLINQCFGHESHYLFAKDPDDHIIGVLPMIRLKSRIFGDFLISMPYFNYGGVIGDSPEIEQKLIESANDIGASLPVKHIEYRDEIARTGLATRTDKVNMILTLPSNESELWKNIGSKLRAQIKRPQRENPRVCIGKEELIDDFYTVFAHNMRDLGTPVYGKYFFTSILQSFPDQSHIIIIYLKNQPISAGFLLGDKGTLEIPWASTVRKVNHLSMNMLLYWEILKFAINNNYQYFDFGRSSKDAGTYRFKQQWGAKPKPSYWHYWLAEDGELPNLNPKNPKYALVISIWKKLPIFITKWLGPHIVKNLP